VVGAEGRCQHRPVAARVLIVDDHAPFRSLARRLLVVGGFQVVGEAADGAEALSAARDLAPDVVLLDIQLPDVDGFTVAEALAAEVRAPIVVLVSSRALLDYGHRVDASTARGFIAKADLSGETLLRVITGPGRPVPCSG
jgi:DNA-binding NarL/FixJ family response regulator